MMKKLLFIFSLCLAGSSFAQNQLLYTENFQVGNTFTLNAGGPGPNTGTNNWILNNMYSGAPTYGPTMPQDSTYSGTIGFAPNSTYLHIHDQASGVTNASYDPSNISDNFAY